MKSFKQHSLEETINNAFDYHLENDIPLSECIFRTHSEKFYEFFEEAKNRYQQGLLEVTNTFDIELLNTDIGQFAVYENETVPIDIPIMEEVELNKPKRGGPKKFYVYVKNDKGNIVKVNFGDTSGLDVNFDDLEARKSFASRHQCHLKTDKTTPGYWSCNLPKYSKSLGLSGGGSFFW